MATWRQQHSRWDYLLWDDGSAEAFIRRQFGAVEAMCFKACRIPAMRSDVFRLAILLAQGGVYADADFLCLQPVTPLLTSPCTLVYVERRKGAQILNGLMLAEPDQPFLRAAWAAVIGRIRHGPNSCRMSLCSADRGCWQRSSPPCRTPRDPPFNLLQKSSCLSSCRRLGTCPIIKPKATGKIRPGRSAASMMRKCCGTSLKRRGRLAWLDVRRCVSRIGLVPEWRHRRASNSSRQCRPSQPPRNVLPRARAGIGGRSDRGSGDQNSRPRLC